MADDAKKTVLVDGPLYHVVHLTNVSDGTGEAGVVKVDRSALTGVDGQPVGRLCIEQIEWDVQGFTRVELHWDHTADDRALILGPGAGEADYGRTGGLCDPQSDGGTGDLLLTTAGAASGDSYAMTIKLRKRG
jgi:hypothetical protein